MKIKFVVFALFIACLSISCDNEDLDDLGERVAAVDLIAEESELFDLLSRVASDDGDQEELTCIEFIYAFTVVTYDENLEIINSAIVSTDPEFYQYLQDVGENEFINVSFPITSTDQDGNTFEVNNKEELAIAIGECKEIIEEQIIGECTTLLLECVWEVAIPESSIYNTYTNAVFDTKSNGNVNFFYRGDLYQGTWIVYFINDELHININLANEDEVGEDWNFDWKTEIVNNFQMDLINDAGDAFILRKECEAENYCKTLTYFKCEDEATPGIASINPNDYTECVIIIAAPQQEFNENTGQLSDPIEWIVTYHTNLQEAEDNANPIASDIEVMNDGLGVTVYARIQDPETQEHTIAEVILQATQCD